MIGAIPNPTKKVTIDFPLNKVKEGILNLPKMFKKYRLEKQNPMFNQYTLDGSEFLSLGVYIDFNLTSVTDNRTDVAIEVRRKLGAFDNWVEVQNANEHIQKIMDGLSKILTSPNGQVEQVKESSNWLKVLGWIIGISILVGIFS
jgi:hypothetical protein